MPTRRFKRIALAQLLLSGCAVIFGVCVLIEHAQAQQPSVPTGPIPAPPTQSPTLNPSTPYTLPSVKEDSSFTRLAKQSAELLPDLLRRR